MTPYRRVLAAMIAAFILLLAPARAEMDLTPYDRNAPENLMPGHLYAEAALLIDRDSGEVLFSKNSKVRMFPASTTKIMTLLLGIESGISLDEMVTIPAEAGNVPAGSSVIPVKPGDEMSFRDLLYSFMLTSGNDGANAVAVLVDGSLDAFVSHMNARAQELGLEGTHYVNAHGYHDTAHYTTAQDLASLARVAMENEIFRDVVAQPKWSVTVTRGGVTKTADVVSRNSLLQSGTKYYYPDCNGIKTGHHGKAGWCFVGSAERDGMRLICVVLNCAQEDEKWFDAARLFEYGFTRYADVPAAELLPRAARAFNTVQIEEAADGVETLELHLYDVSDGGATVRTIGDSEAALDSRAEQMAQSAEITWTRALKAPVGEGEIMGNVRCALPDGGEVKALLVAARAVAAPATPEPVIVTEAPRPAVTEAADELPAQNPEPVPAPADSGNAPLLIIGLLVLLLICAVAAVFAVNSAHRRKARRRRHAHRRGTGR